MLAGLAFAMPYLPPPIEPELLSVPIEPELPMPVLPRSWLGADGYLGLDVIDRQAVTDEVTFARRLSAKFNWALLDVTRRSIEETAAAIMKLLVDRQRQRPPE